jgi:hypothetical protein
MRRKFGLILWWVVLITFGTWAQPSSLTPSTSPKAKTRSESPAKSTLKIPVWVEQDKGIFWNEGKRQSFKVFLDDKEVAIKSFQHPKSSSIILVVFDTVANLARVDEARNALQYILKDLNEQYWIGLLSAQNGLSVLQEPTADRQALNKKIHSIQVTGKAGLLDTLEPISQMATAILQKAAVRLSVLYVTDSSISHYRADYLNPVINSSDAGDLSRRFSDRAVQERISRLSKSLSSYTVPLFILHLEQRSDTLNLAYQSGLDRLAANSGGKAIFCRTSDEIRPSLLGLINQIRAGYIVTVEPPQTKRTSFKVRVEASDASGNSFQRITHVNQFVVKKK